VSAGGSRSRRAAWRTESTLVSASALPCQCGPQSRVDLLRGLLLYVRGNVAVGVQGDADVGVPEALRNHHGVHTGLQQLDRVRVAQIVEAALDLLLVLEAPPDAVEARGPPRTPRPLVVAVNAFVIG
jgi:hypothetical protein